jgi:hypothetical protein
MELARRAGCSRYDMWGISTRVSPRTEGFIRFKQKFGGTVEEYPGAYFRILSYPKLLKLGAAPFVARGARFATGRYLGARKLGGKASVHRDTGEPPEEQTGARHRSAGRYGSVKRLITLGVYSFTSDVYARAFASDDAVKAFGKRVAGPSAPFIGSMAPQPPSWVAAYR